MQDSGEPEEYPLLKDGSGKGTVTPHSVAVGPDGYLWVTTHDSTLVQVNPSSLANQLKVTRDIRTLSAGIIPDPCPNRADGKKVVWFASPAHEQDYDPVIEYDIANQKRLNEFKLADDARAQTIAWLLLNTGTDEAPVWAYWIMFAEPVHTMVGYCDPEDESSTPGTYPFPDAKQNPVYDTWLWSVAVTAPKEAKSLKDCVYWATGQVSTTGNYERKTNSLYRYAPPHDDQPKPISLPGGSGQKPVHVVASPNGDAVWVGAENPNQICRYDTELRSWTRRDISGSGTPRQMMLGTDGNLWVACSNGIARFRTDKSITQLPGPALPSGGDAMGLCLDKHGNKWVWYTNPTNKSIGKYPIPPDPGSAGGKTQFMAQLVSETAPGRLTGMPGVVQYISKGLPIPGVPLTCRVVSEGGTTFIDGSTEILLTTDARGRAALPALRAGREEDQVVLEVGHGLSEPPTTFSVCVRCESDESPEADES
ncbi:hypothetical protein [Streptomyces morookaense]|uniref:Virginiamycin B lyase n=1 Tax=Streptomyces morookaense TaxID=1970 RepID=A0A7Y7AZX7_STRMO|nr:hypothetical protein [Streptomyces morookaense]NVK76402.1 hypothetical protein [Streptomyces morookaense]GHF06775.1 hypothetical protein GCM10010359_04830 [Streptomyces morookaense]